MSAYAARLKQKMLPLSQALRELNDLEELSDEQKTDFDRMKVELKDMKADYDLAIARDVVTSDTITLMDGLDQELPQPRAQAPRPQTASGATAEVKALSSYLLDSHDYRHPRSGMYNVSGQAPIAALYPFVERKTPFIPTNLTYASGNVQIFGPNTPQVPHPFLELLRTVPYNDLSVPYLAPVFTNNAADVPIGQAKPESTNTGAIQTVSMHTIAHWKEVPRQILRYMPAMRAIIDDELIGGVLSKVEDQVINSTGAGGSMNGILNQITASTVTTDMVLAILNALGVIGARGGMPNGIVMNPSDYFALQGSAYTGNKANPIIVNGRFAGVPVVQTGALAAGTTIVGDWTRGAALYVGENANVRATEALGFKTNIVTVLSEMDAVILVERPLLLMKTAAPIT